MADNTDHGIGQHDQGDMPVPTVPGAALVVIETKFILGGLEALLHAPAGALDTNQGVNRGAMGTPGGEVGEFAVEQAAADQQAAAPGPRNWRVLFVGIEIGERAIGPIIEPLAFSACPYPHLSLGIDAACTPQHKSCKRCQPRHKVCQPGLCLVAEHCWDPVGQAIVDYSYYFEHLAVSLSGEK